MRTSVLTRAAAIVSCAANGVRRAAFCHGASSITPSIFTLASICGTIVDFGSGMDDGVAGVCGSAVRDKAAIKATIVRLNTKTTVVARGI